MRLALALKGKLKIAIALAFFSITIISFNLLMKNKASWLEKSVKSIYSDRLIAGSNIAGIIETAYESHLLLEEHIHCADAGRISEIEKAIALNNEEIDSLLQRFKATILTEDEKLALHSFEQNHQIYLTAQKELLAQSRAGEKQKAYDDYLMHGNKLFQQILFPTHQLSFVQTAGGQELYTFSQSHVRMAQVISTLEAALVVIICLTIYIVLKAANLIL